MTKALFLDRDGVINKDHGYVYKIEDIDFLPGIFDVARAAHEKGYLLVVVTNQSGIGRGYYTEDDFHTVMSWMQERFAEEGAPLTDIYYCPFHEEAEIEQYRKISQDYKPAPGMLLKAIEKYTIDPAQSLIIGDRSKDMQAGEAAGVATRLHYTTKTTPSEVATQHITSLNEALAFII